MSRNAQVSVMLKKCREALEPLGVEILGVRQGGHMMIRVRNRHGREGSLPVSMSPGDHRRGWKNWITQARRFSTVTKDHHGRAGTPGMPFLPRKPKKRSR